jgi:sialate O-acetylesterase
MRYSFVLVALAILVTPVRAGLELPALFSDHAVLQAGDKVPVWGWADAGAEVKVSFAGQELVGKAGADGKWMVELVSLKAEAEGREMTVSCGSVVSVIEDVLVGEVWLGSGQSNMAMTVSRARDFDKERTEANLANIRFFTVQGSSEATAQARCKGGWVVCSPETVGQCSATLFFFGKQIEKKMNSPIGLINSSVGGSPIESWIGKDAQMSDPGLKAFFEKRASEEAAFDEAASKAAYEKQMAVWVSKSKEAKAKGGAAPKRPQNPIEVRARKGDVGGLFNGKIAPLVPFAIRGVIWYQGEANSNGFKAPFYDEHLTLLATEWRRLWSSEFPIVWVQLPNFEAKREGGWMMVREGMLKAHLAVPKSGMVVTLDAGDAKDIHPKDKQTVGERLATWALADVYGKGGASCGPLVSKHEVRGTDVVVSFAHADGGLVLRETKDNGGASGFEVAGADKVWRPGKARVQGTEVIIWNEDVSAPVAVRYAWAEVAPVTLWNGAGLPASPFRTAEW